MIINIFTDGSLIRKDNTVFCGYGIYFPNKENKNISKKFTKTPITNNRAELYSIYKSLKICKKINKQHTINQINIYSDSEYCVKTINIWHEKWTLTNKEYKNKDLIDKIIKYKNLFNNTLNIIHIKSHTNKKDFLSIGNDNADKLAKNGALK